MDGSVLQTTRSVPCLLTRIIHLTTIDQTEDSYVGRTRESVAGWWGRSRRFLSEVRNEMGRVTWPGRKEVYATTLVVILFSVAMGVYLWLVDLGLGKALAWVYHLFGGA
jgi:preprotein translocase subunit SecE